jgi:ornithine cyclodeaminase/alanine dehydrogenase-like protein (mu-crystallin family)
MLYMTEEQVRKSMPIYRAIPIVRKSHEDCAGGLIFYSDRITLHVREDDSVIWMPACTRHLPYFGVKYATGFPGNAAKGLPTVISQISLYSADTGELLCILSANYLTALKTGASAAVATDIMARKDATKLGIIGTGVQAFTQVTAIQEIRRITELRIYDLDEARVDGFIARVKEVQDRPYPIIKADSGDDCVAGSEIICTCTPSTTPVFHGDSLKAGSHLNAIGSYTPLMQEVDEETVMKAGKVVTEHVDELWKVAGDLLIPLEKGLITKEKVTGSVGDVLTGKAAGRESDQEITMYESNGSGVLDLSIAIAVYEQFAVSQTEGETRQKSGENLHTT